MKKQIHPGVVVAAVVAIIAVVGFLFYQNTVTPAPQSMGPMGPGMAALRKNGGDISKNMTPEEKQMMQQSMAGKH